MTNVRTMISALALSSFVAGTLAAGAVTATSADADWAAWEAAADGMCQYYESQEICVQSTVVQAMPVQERREQHLLSVEDAFYTKYPLDKRRWSVALRYITSNAGFFVIADSGMLVHDLEKDLTPEEMLRRYKGPVPEWNRFAARFSTDRNAEAAWLRRRKEMLNDALASSALSVEEKENVEFQYFDWDAYRATKEIKGETSSDWKRIRRPMRGRFDAHVSKYKDLPVMKDRVSSYMGGFGDLVSYMGKYGIITPAEGTGMLEEEWRHLLDSPSAIVRDTAKVRLADLAAKQWQGYDFVRFTAMDGREVDLSRLRGKLVLLEFWALWCKPCIEELPRLKALYREHHEKGLEIVGISCDSDQEKGKVIQLLKGNAVEWPQHFDGQGWNNKYRQLFGISALPASLLIDRNGRLVAKGARGETLESLVRRELQREADIVAPGPVWKYQDDGTDLDLVLELAGSGFDDAFWPAGPNGAWLRRQR